MMDSKVSRSLPAPLVTMFLIATPAMLFFLLGIRAIEPMNGQDGYLYVGVVARLTDFLTRFPESYYGVRFGHILPTWLFTQFFGFEVAHYLWRFILLGAICALLRFGGLLAPLPSLFAAIVVSTSPIIAVSVYTTYVSSTAILTLIVGSLLLAYPDDVRPNSARIFAASAFLTMSWNANFATFPLCGIVSSIFLLDRFFSADQRSLKRILLPTTTLLIGICAVLGTGVLVYGINFNIWNIFSPTLAQATKGTDSLFVDPGWAWISWRHYLLLGPISIAIGAYVWLTERDLALAAVVRKLLFFSITCLTIFACAQWIMGSPLLSLYFYSAFPLGLCSVLLAYSTAVLIGRESGVFQILFAVALTTSGVLGYVLGEYFNGQFLLLILLIIIFTLILAAGAIFNNWARMLGFLGLFLAASWCVVSSPHDFLGTPGGYRADPMYDDVLSAYDYGSLDRAVVLNEIASALPTLPEDRGEIRLWFDTRQPYDQLSAPFLWWRSALQSPNDPLIPEVSQTVRSRVVNDRPRYIVLISKDKERAVDGSQRIKAIAPHNVVWKKLFSHGQIAAEVVLLERNDGAWKDFPCYAPDVSYTIVCASSYQ